MNVNIEISEQPLDVGKAWDQVKDPSAGGHDLFIGTVRDDTKGRRVVKLHFESYGSMAQKEMQKIIDRAIVQFEVLNIAIHHRVGELKVGEIAVIIAVSAAHRDAAFKACRFCIDELKKTVPIWKKEFFEDGEVWVAAHP